MTTVIPIKFTSHEKWFLEKGHFIADLIGEQMENYYTINQKVPERVCVRIDKVLYSYMDNENFTHIFGVPVEYSRDWSLKDQMVITIY